MLQWRAVAKWSERYLLTYTPSERPLVTGKLKCYNIPASTPCTSILQFYVNWVLFHVNINVANFFAIERQTLYLAI